MFPIESQRNISQIYATKQVSLSLIPGPAHGLIILNELAYGSPMSRCKKVWNNQVSREKWLTVIGWVEINMDPPKLACPRCGKAFDTIGKACVFSLLRQSSGDVSRMPFGDALHHQASGVWTGDNQGNCCHDDSSVLKMS